MYCDAALQLDPTTADSRRRRTARSLYNNGFWAVRIDGLPGCDAPLFVPFMSGYGGIRVVLMPNDVAYYYFSDGGEFRFRRAIAGRGTIRPYCTPARRHPRHCRGSGFMNSSTSAPGRRVRYGVPGLRKASPNGEIARVLLAFLASAGLFYVNIMPALVDGLIHGAGFSNRQAGMVGSSNVYGAALGALDRGLPRQAHSLAYLRPTDCSLG